MPDLHDGESVEMQGSATRPYVLKNLAGVYSCSCPAWRNQSLPIDRRTCKHLRRLHGDAAEEARVGAALPALRLWQPIDVKTPALLLAQTWDEHTDPAGWWLSEKLDGVRAYWDGCQFLSRQGNRYHAPTWFTAGLPDFPLDGELWAGRKQFQRTVAIVRRHEDARGLWKEVRFVIFDAPAAGGGFEERFQLVRRSLEKRQLPYAHSLPHAACRGIRHLTDELNRIESLGGEGLMLRQPCSLYQAGRSPTLLKVKRFRDAEALVVGHEPGSGRHKGRLGALLVEMADGTRFAVGSGLTDLEREQPPSVGSTIVFRYQELTDRGVPRFPTFVGVCRDPERSLTPNNGGLTVSVKSGTPRRRFEYSEGSSNKFWEISAAGPEVTVRFGRIGTTGQVQSKSFPDTAAAVRHAEKLVQQKLGKGYREVA
jgi:DNA ligase-1